MAKVAWKVKGEEDSEWIVFAEDEEEAQRLGSFELITDTDCVEASREPDYDQYAELGYVPPKVLIDDYWTLNCEECEHGVDKDNEHEDEDEEGDAYYPEPVFQGKLVFCQQSCCDTWHKDREIARQRRDEAKEFLMEKYPKAEKLSIRGGMPNYEVSASFGFGGQAMAEWKSSDPEVVSILFIDKEKFEEWRSLQTTQKGLNND